MTDLWGYDQNSAEQVHQLPTGEVAQYRIHEPSARSYGGDENFDWGWLRDDISRNGVQNPVTVYTDGSRAHLDDGNHRATLAHEVGVPHVPAHVVQLSPEDYDGYADDHQGLPGGPRLVGPALRAILSPHTAARTAMPWYHNTDQDFSPGDELKPASELGIKNKYWSGFPSYDPDMVYFYHGNEDPQPHADQDFGPNTHEVEPRGGIQPYPEFEMHHPDYSLDYPDSVGEVRTGDGEDSELSHLPGYHDHMAPGARIIRKINPRESRTMTAAVTVYTSPSCPQCFATKKHLDKLGIEHQTVDVTQDPEAHAFVTGLGYSSAPVVVAGDDHWSGYRDEKIKELAERMKHG